MKILPPTFAAAGLLAGWISGAVAQVADPAPEAKEISPKVVARNNAAKIPVTRPGDGAPPEEANLTLNFRGAPLETILSYLSEAAGFTIVLQTSLHGTADVWSSQPLTRSEALEVLTGALAKNGLAYFQNGRTLTIVSQDDARKSNMPVKQGAKAQDIPKNDEIVTQVMPLSHINASQLIRDLQSLLPKNADITANEGGNAIIITDTQANIRHFAEIIEAIDTSVSSVASIKVFPLKFADSKAVASVIKDLFSSDSSSNSSSRNGSGAFGGATSRFGGGLPAGVGVDAGGGATRDRSGSSRSGTSARVVAVADDRSNSVVVTAPDDLMGTIEELVKAVDSNVEDVTELRVFRLKYADPTEMADLLSNLFPDETKQNNGSNGQTSSRFGSPFGTPFGGFGSTPGRTSSGGSSSGASSDRAKKLGRVVAVADPRTVSVVVSAAHDLMRQIEQMVTSLDADKGKNQTVKVYNLENADAQQVQQLLQDLFQTQQNNQRRNSAASTSPLTSRSTTQAQTQGVGSTTIGNTGGGGGGRGQGGGGGIP